MTPLTSQASAEIVNFVKDERYRRAHRSVETLQQFWAVMADYYDGYQTANSVKDARAKWGAIAENTKSFNRSAVINRIFAHVNSVVAEYVASLPRWHVVPGNDSDDARSAAHFAEQLLEWWFVESRGEIKLIEALTLMKVMNSAFVHIGWNPKEGPECPYMDESGQLVMGRGGIPTFDIRTPFEIYLPPWLRSPLDFGKTPWLIDVIEQDVEEIHAETGVRVSPDSVSVEHSRHGGLTNLFKRFSQMVTSSADASALDNSHHHMVRRYRYWEIAGRDMKTGQEHPSGRFIDVAGDTLLYYDDQGKVAWPDRVPYVMFFSHLVPGRFWPTSEVEQMLPLQDEYNEIRQQRREWNAAFVRPRWFMRRGSVNPQAMASIASSDGPVIEYDGVEKPHPMVAPSPPPDMVNELRTVETDMHHVAGFHAASHGETPKGVRTLGQELQQIEQDRRRRGPSNKLIGDSIAQMAELVLRSIRRYMPDQCQIKVGGKDEAYGYITFQRSNLDDNTDVRIDPSTIVIDTKSSKHMMIADLMHNGIFNAPAETQRKIFRMVGLDDVVHDVDDVDRGQMNDAQLENELMKAGSPVPVLPSQDDEIHLFVCRRVTSRTDFLNYPPQIQEIFIQHEAQHMNNMAVKLGMAAGLKMEASGANLPQNQAPKGANQED